MAHYDAESTAAQEPTDERVGLMERYIALEQAERQAKRTLSETADRLDDIRKEAADLRLAIRRGIGDDSMDAVKSDARATR